MDGVVFGETPNSKEKKYERKTKLNLFCLLNAVKGGSSKTSLWYEYCTPIDLQCLATIIGIEGSRGSYFMANTGRFFLFFSFHF